MVSAFNSRLDLVKMGPSPVQPEKNLTRYHHEKKHLNISWYSTNGTFSVHATPLAVALLIR